eukprot:TRINITY_DN2302_c0_g1_i6.p2 TRINITY_DN2302_c0_g1~~TRINITY_DN2302_c0_g1_i6.p2  ORF type:complete len:206 (+),score=53.73 TRINITY_DN2302_c0_g1_i6:537-1154(+)
MNEFRQLNVNNLLSTMNSDQVRRISETGDYIEALAGTKEFTTLANYLDEITDYNEKMSGQIIEKVAYLQSVKDRVEKKARELEERREQYLKKLDQINFIGERFNKSKVLNLLDNSINELEERAMEDLMDTNLSSVFSASTAPKYQMDPQSFEEKCRRYLETRKQYYTLLIKKEKLSEIAQNVHSCVCVCVFLYLLHHHHQHFVEQ